MLRLFFNDTIVLFVTPPIREFPFLHQDIRVESATFVYRLSLRDDRETK